jgi:nitroimidazol reductase NimA-like FMN-containing flavoprotein (pyridoxamine 5'-phosphate oxidase superfamily)
MTSNELAAIVDANSYMTLATADADGRPWATPVWFAHEGYREFFWVSDPEARHSLNIAVRGDVGIVIFDSRVAPGAGSGVSLEATAAELVGDERERGIGVFSRRSVAEGLSPWSLANVTAPARHRVYRAVAGDVYVLGDDDRRVPVNA